MSILSERYASNEMRQIWSTERKVIIERILWIDIMRFQASFLSIPEDAIKSYESVLQQVNLDRITEREAKTRHDVKARIDEFNSLADHQYIHLGMTSRDLTENVELFQIRESLQIVIEKTALLLDSINQKIEKYSDLAMVGRTHNMPAQVTTLGRRFASWAEELIFAFENLENLCDRIPLRGIKGAIGTSSDLGSLIGSGARSIDGVVQESLGFTHSLEAPNQTYPRSIDFEVISCLVQIAMAPSNIATNIRLMSGIGIVAEDFGQEQTGSSAMPHKINPRLSERVNSLTVVMKGFLTMISGISGNQWNEGDVACSATRRVALQDSFMAVDGILDTTIYLVRTLNVFEGEINRELEENLPTLLSTKILSLAVLSGARREEAHEALKRHSHSGLNDKRVFGRNTFLERVVSDSSLRVSQELIDEVQGNPLSLTGFAHVQSMSVSHKIREILMKFNLGLTYQERPII